MKIVPKNWRDFQHYKDRNPPWIRLHKALLDNFDFHCLPVASRALAPMLWLLASDSVDGVIDAAPERLAFRLRQAEKDISAALKPLIDKGFFSVVQDASNALAERKQDAVPETEALQSRAEPSARGTRLPDDWIPSDEDKAFAIHLLNGRSETEVEKFRDYWTAKPGKGGVKLDWSATWRNWCRQAAEYGTKGVPAKQSGSIFDGAL